MGHIIASYSSGNVNDAHFCVFQIFFRTLYTQVGNILGNGTAHIFFEKIDCAGIAICGFGNQIGLDGNIGKIGLGNFC